MPRDGATARGIWSGSISFGLVTVPVELHSATRRERPRLRQLAADGIPLAREYVCPKDGTVLSRDDIARGYEVADGKFVTVTDEELERLAPRRSRDIELTRFVDRAALDPAHFERSYVLVPGGEQSKAYRLLAETMEATKRAAIAHFVMRGKAYAVAILADRGVLRAEVLRFGDEVRTPEQIGLPKAPDPDEKRIAAMSKIVQRLAKRTVNESELDDEEAEDLLTIAKKKQKRGEDLIESPEAPAEPEEEGAEVVDLMALIKERMRRANGGGKAAARPSRAKRARKKRTTKKSRARGGVKRRARRGAARRT